MKTSDWKYQWFLYLNSIYDMNFISSCNIWVIKFFFWKWGISTLPLNQTMHTINLTWWSSYQSSKLTPSGVHNIGEQNDILYPRSNKIQRNFLVNLWNCMIRSDNFHFHYYIKQEHWSGNMWSTVVTYVHNYIYLTVRVTGIIEYKQEDNMWKDY
jgi:hypothetical protein